MENYRNRFPRLDNQAAIVATNTPNPERGNKNHQLGHIGGHR